ncbi:UPF0481 protein At3g47200-like [Impatiens glandulifera]|uniref:UPF0481 protein At3g47200-like n=1 Tax=Impatiens glandulifera TaxID=253017 RepID=UPI001FB0E76A|nr:UPF0481 protein At3g47200-like [Impatiens glandulifera]
MATNSNDVVSSILDRIHRDGLLRMKEYVTIGSSVIGRVSPFLRSNDFNHHSNYDPKIVSIGPYHHGKPELEMMEKFKPLIARLLFPNRADLNNIYNKILQIADDLKSCYDDVSTKKITNFNFAEMMLLDSCLVIALVIEPHFKLPPIFIPSLSVLHEDLLLLENQLPFRVLKLVTGLLISVDDDNEVIRFISEKVDHMPNLMLNNANKHRVNSNDQFQQQGRPQPVHLFELHYRNLTLKTTKVQGTRVPSSTTENYMLAYGSVKELKSRGIHFRPSKTRFLNGIYFTSYFFFAKLQLPPIFFDSNFGIIVSNTIAFEQSRHDHVKPEIISYMLFLRSMIDGPNDVKELRCKRIINTRGMCDEQIADVFKKMNWGGNDLSKYYEVRGRIDEHYNNKLKTIIPKLLSSYFNNPWTFIVCAAATTGIAMTTVQAYYAIHHE